jgi:hypothetical protein
VYPNLPNMMLNIATTALDGAAKVRKDMKNASSKQDAPVNFLLLPIAVPLAPGEHFPEGVHISDTLPADTDDRRIDPHARAWFESAAYTHDVNGAPLNFPTHGTLIDTTTFTNQGESGTGDLSSDVKRALIDGGNMYHTFYGDLDKSQLATNFTLDMTVLTPIARSRQPPPPLPQCSTSSTHCFAHWRQRKPHTARD